MLMLMEHSAESVPSSYVKAGELGRSCQRYGQRLERAGVRDALVRVGLEYANAAVTCGYS
jgi:hypothetical protein